MPEGGNEAKSAILAEQYSVSSTDQVSGRQGLQITIRSVCLRAARCAGG